MQKVQINQIKLSGSGVIEATGYAYKASVKIKTSIITEHKEELLEFIIPCDSNAEAAELGVMFRVLKNNILVFYNNCISLNEMKVIKYVY